MKKKIRFRNGWFMGFRRGEWWIGVRHDFGCDWAEVGFLGLSLIIPKEAWYRRQR